MNVLVIDVGGSKVKLRVSSGPEVRRFASGRQLKIRRRLAENAAAGKAFQGLGEFQNLVSDRDLDLAFAILKGLLK